MHEDHLLDVVIAVANAFVEAEAPEWETLRPSMQLTLAMVAQRTVDEGVRVRWFRSPIGREMTRLAGPIEEVPASGGEASADGDTKLLQRLVQGKTNREIADELGVDEQTVARRLGELFARVGVSSRAEATALAFRERVL
jgi:DNA-binding NarL/FixJ family response regulator